MDIEIGGRIKMLWEDEETVNLVIKNVTEKDAGMYQVFAKNELGECDCDCKLTIRGEYSMFLHSKSTLSRW